MRYINLMPSPTVMQMFNKPNITYKPADIWQIFNNLANGQEMTKDMTDELFDFFLSIGILTIYKRYPDKAVQVDDKWNITNPEQIDYMMEVVLKLYDYYTAEPNRALKGFPSTPSTVDEERMFHSQFTKKGANLLKDGWRKRENDPLKRKVEEANAKFGDGEQADERRTAIHAEAMASTPDYLYKFTSEGVTLDLLKACASEDIYKAVSDKAKDTINAIYTNEHLKKLMPKISSKDFSSIVMAILSLSGFKILHEKESDLAFFIEGPKGSIAGGSLKSDTSSKRAVTICQGQPKKVDWDNALALQKQQKADSILFITSDYESDEFKKARKDSKFVIYETWELIDLVDNIRDRFDELPESEQDRLKSLIEELVTDF